MKKDDQLCDDYTFEEFIPLHPRTMHESTSSDLDTVVKRSFGLLEDLAEAGAGIPRTTRDVNRLARIVRRDMAMTHNAALEIAMAAISGPDAGLTIGQAKRASRLILKQWMKPPK